MGYDAARPLKSTGFAHAALSSAIISAFAKAAFESNNYFHKSTTQEKGTKTPAWQKEGAAQAQGGISKISFGRLVVLDE